jgi:hypothetical protein
MILGNHRGLPLQLGGGYVVDNAVNIEKHPA